MEQSPHDRAKDLAQDLLDTTQWSEQLVEDSQRIARDLHRQGIETDEQLARAEEIAARVAETSNTVRLLADKIQQQKRKPKGD